MSDAVSSGLWVNKSSRARALSLVCGGGSGGCWSSAASGAVSVEGGDGWVGEVKVAMVLLSVCGGCGREQNFVLLSLPRSMTRRGTRLHNSLAQLTQLLP